MDWTELRAKIAKQGMRNSNCLAIAPTATISNVMGTSPCIEPTYKNLFVKSNLSGEFIVLNQYLVKDLKQRGLLKDTLVVWCTEFGRMPTFQKGASGRDHNPDGFTGWLAGAGVKRGHTYGTHDSFEWKA